MSTVSSEKPLDALQHVFGGTITKADIPRLRAMAAATRDSFYTEVAEVVERVGAIEFFGQW